jgi:hypothetical protein
MTDPIVQSWRTGNSALGGRLVDVESLPNVVLARSGILTGGSAATWADADATISRAWAAYQALEAVLDEVERTGDPHRATALMAATPVATAQGPATDPGTALAAAQLDVDTAVAVVGRLGEVWDSLAPRVGAARAKAAACGDTDTERAALALAELMTTDPLAVTAADVVEVEAKAEASGSRHAASQMATARLDVDLPRARDLLARLDTDAQGAATELAHAASRLVGVATTTPVRDLDALGTWLDRIATAATSGDRGRAATDLTAWFAAAQARRDELDAALAPARSGMERREQGRGLWSALRAKAGARKLDETPEVVAALARAKDLLWSAPCDLDAAEAALTDLSRTLTKRPLEDR